MFFFLSSSARLSQPKDCCPRAERLRSKLTITTLFIGLDLLHGITPQIRYKIRKLYVSLLLINICFIWEEGHLTGTVYMTTWLDNAAKVMY